MKFSDELWFSIDGIFKRILEHPFIKGLIDGSLDLGAFKFYIIQDALYLKDFSRGLAILGAKSEEDDDLLLFCEHSRNAIIVERSLHESFFKDFSLSKEDVYKTEKAPINLLYTSYLIRVAYERPYYEAIGAFLPCYWIYLEVGKFLEKFGSKNELYQRWIRTYSSEQFEISVRAVIDITNRISENLNDYQKNKIKEHFIITTKFEYMFWDMGYKKQTWEV